MPSEIEKYCVLGSEETRVPLSIIRGIVLYESKGDLKASNKNRNGTIDLGPGQLNSQYLSYYEWKFNKGKKIDPHSAESILITARIMAANYKEFRDWMRAITAYRWGITGTKKHGVDDIYVWNVLNEGGYYGY